ncbi:hypothetical protein J5N97_006211 [Dioscorea zingiberensis]|uniref:Ubiquitin thioesterase OTU n=1 Tax=Dioscorea zingiberensis TaxID=325984 RepID=A0A9D5HSK6_9LILI|nr:hypothetical protein J5N97_006211 [Dioscorea zingiberensis]
MAKSRAPSNDVLLQQLRDGTAVFELQPAISQSPTSVPFFARIGPSLGAVSPAMKKVQRYSVRKVTGDGRCLFRALVKGMAHNKGISLGSGQERDDADELRMAVKEIICESDKDRLNYEEALVAITVEESLKRYCQRIERSDFWGGESELLVLSKLCHQPIIVYIPEHEHTGGARGSGFIPIAEYGSEFGKTSKKGKKRMPVKLLYSGNNHYDLLV